MCIAICMCVIWDLVRLLFRLPSSAPKYPEARSHLPKKKKKKKCKNRLILIQLSLCFLPEALAEGAAGDRPWSQVDSASLEGYKRARERVRGGKLVNFSSGSGAGCGKSLLLLAAGRPGRQSERDREAEKEDKYRTPHSINHILLCNFTLAYTNVHTQTHKVEWTHSS